MSGSESNLGRGQGLCEGDIEPRPEDEAAWSSTSQSWESAGAGAFGRGAKQGGGGQSRKREGEEEEKEGKGKEGEGMGKMEEEREGEGKGERRGGRRKAACRNGLEWAPGSFQAGCAQTPSPSSELTHAFQIHTAFSVGLGRAADGCVWVSAARPASVPFWSAGFQVPRPVMGCLQGALDGVPANHSQSTPGI